MSDYWSWNNAVDSEGAVVASLSGTSGDLVSENVRDPRVAKKWRAASSPSELRIQLPAVGGVSMFGVFGANFADLGSLTLGLGTADGSGDLWETTVSVDELAIAHQAVFILRTTAGLLAPVNASHAFVRSTGSIPLEVGRVWIGTADWEASASHTYDSEWQMIDLTTRSVTPRSGAYLIDRNERRASFTPSYDALRPEEYAGTLRRMDRDRGLASQFLFIPNPDIYDVAEFAILGYLTELPANAFLGYLRGGRTMTIVEAG